MPSEGYLLISERSGEREESLFLATGLTPKLQSDRRTLFLAQT